MNKVIISSLAALLVVGLIVSRVKYEVIFLKKQLREINTKIEKYSDDLKVYNAEWAYLNSPKRLKELCEKYLKHLRPTTNKQVVNYQLILNNSLVQSKGSAFKDYLDKMVNSGGD